MTTATNPGQVKAIKMAPKIAYRNLFHDRMSLIVTLVGIVFSVVLVAIQCGLYLGSESKIATVLDRTSPDLWIVPIGTKSFDDPSLMTGREKYAALSTPGVQSVEEMVVSFSAWRKPLGGKKAFILVGLDWENGGLKPWNLDRRHGRRFGGARLGCRRSILLQGSRHRWHRRQCRDQWSARASHGHH